MHFSALVIIVMTYCSHRRVYLIPIADHKLKISFVFTGRLNDLCSSSLLAVEAREDCEAALMDVNDLLCILHSFLDHYTDLVMQLEDQECYAHVMIPTIQTGRAGRPPFSISQSQIEVLVELGYSYAQIARMLGISDRTLLRRREMFGLPIGQSYSNIIDEELDVIVRTVYQVQ